MGWVDMLSGSKVGVDTIFLTNDRKLPSLPGMQTLVLDDLKEISDDGPKVS
jgi:hypothetical protein